MSFEIERRFLVCQDIGGLCRHGDRIIQGYFPFDRQSRIRVRIRNDHAYLTIKGPRRGAVRSEFESDIPLAIAASMLSQLPRETLVEKVRYTVPYAGLMWEIDVFGGLNAGLVVAEVELSHPEQEVVLPHWVGREITYDARYGNSRLSVEPISSWTQAA
ncbi:CYTH domain-containing protein [Skermanella sp. TT6]|uniref:CYTH domain-containing protein n=1 Tax=Skermanella cutis TaxID=2775420 RepID=A0ABX7BAN8_9PROT|nr:CYTH domain-containing protein [Skermanella sp. TT6]QQP91465.1 CYTH domain-containing protein [Skermanella sp. TT6]